MNYDIKCFAANLKRGRLFRGYRTQASLCIPLAISRQIWSLWELGKRLPTLNQLAKVANILQLEISYFISEDANPEDFDLQQNRMARKTPVVFRKPSE